jgi:N-sulfoglucosamine sulfohydrolase
LPGGRVLDDLVSLTDVTCTIYEAAGVAPPTTYPPAGRSMLDILLREDEGIVDAARDAVFAGRERHSSSRYYTLGYPQRCIRTQQYLYIRNFKPRRWPAGAPQKYGQGGYAKDQEVIDQVLGDPHGGYHDIDACPTLTYLIAHREDAAIEPFFHLAVDRRPSEELFDIQKDPACLENLAAKPEFADVRTELSARLMDYLTQTGDARVLDADGGDIWETYPRYSGLRWFPTPDWARENPEDVPDLDWLEERRP